MIAAGAIALATPQHVAQEAEFIIVMVPDTPQVDDVLFRADGVAAGLSPNKVVIDAELDLPHRHQGLCRQDQPDRRAVPRCAGVRR